MGQPMSRLVALLGAYFPVMLARRRQQNVENAADRGGYSTDELSSTTGGTTAKMGGSVGGIGTAYFGNHFLMGGELYDTSKPEVFLFGDQQDLDLLGNKPVKFPHCPKGVTDSVNVLNALVNVRRDSVKFSKVGRAGGGGYSSGFYRLEFIFDCDVSCYVQIHFCAKEVVDEHQQTRIACRLNQFESSERFHFPIGANQQFSHFVFKPHRYDLKLMHWDGGTHFPVLIEMRSVSDQFPEQVQTTMCSIERSADQSAAALILKPLKQKLISNGVVFLLQEIFGIENKENAESMLLAEENGAECIICMANPRDTMILPCRHLCICNGCAETLRYKLNNCPICRSPFKALLKIRAMRSSLVGFGGSSDGSASMTRIRREPMTLFEAINGPHNNSASATSLRTGTATVQQQHQPNKAAIIAKCDLRGDVVTTSAALSDPLGLGGHSPNKSRHELFAKTAASASKKRGDQHQQMKRIDLDIGGEEQEHIELDELDSATKRRKHSHATSSFLQYSPGSASITRRSSPSPPLLLYRGGAARAHANNSPLSTANSSYQSARSIAPPQRGNDDEEKEDDDDDDVDDEKTVRAMLASAPNLATIATKASANNKLLSGLGCEDKKNVMMEAVESSSSSSGKKRTTTRKVHKKRMSEPPTPSLSSTSTSNATHAQCDDDR